MTAAREADLKLLDSEVEQKIGEVKEKSEAQEAHFKEVIVNRLLAKKGSLGTEQGKYDLVECEYALKVAKTNVKANLSINKATNSEGNKPPPPLPPQPEAAGAQNKKSSSEAYQRLEAMEAQYKERDEFIQNFYSMNEDDQNMILQEAVSVLELRDQPTILTIGFTQKQLDMLVACLARFDKRVVNVHGYELLTQYKDQIKEELQDYCYDGLDGEEKKKKKKSAEGKSEEEEVAVVLGQATDEKVVKATTMLSFVDGKQVATPLQNDHAMFQRIWEEKVVPAIGPKGYAAKVEVALTASEAFIPLVDWINSQQLTGTPYGRQWNAYRSSAIRRDKFLMQQQFKLKVDELQRQLKSGKLQPEDMPDLFSDGVEMWPKSRQVTNKQEVEEVLATWGEISRNKAVVLKPSLSAGSEHLEVCFSADHVRQGCKRLLGVETKQLTTTQALCIQEYIKGQEFVVDVVSRGLNHVVTDVWVAFKNIINPYPDGITKWRPEPTSPGQEFTEEEIKTYESDPTLADPKFKGVRTIMYRRQELLPHCRLKDTEEELPGGEKRIRKLSKLQRKAAVAVKYAIQVIEALELTHGASHVEIKVEDHDPENEDGNAFVPKLVELNPRLQGDIPRSGGVVEYDQISLLAYLLSDTVETNPTTSVSSSSTGGVVSTAASPDDNGDPQIKGGYGSVPFPPVALRKDSTTKNSSTDDVFPKEYTDHLGEAYQRTDVVEGVNQTLEFPSILGDKQKSSITWYDTRTPLKKIPEEFRSLHDRFVLNTGEGHPHLVPTLRRDLTLPTSKKTAELDSDQQQQQDDDNILVVYYLASFHIHEQSGLLVDRTRRSLKSLPAFQRYTRCAYDTPPQRGSLYRVKRSVDLLASPGAVVLYGRRDLVQNNINLIRDCERCVFNPDYEAGVQVVVEELEQMQEQRARLHAANTADGEHDDRPQAEPPKLSPGMLYQRARQIAERDMGYTKYDMLPHILPDPGHNEALEGNTTPMRLLGFQVAPLYVNRETTEICKDSYKYWVGENMVQYEKDRQIEVAHMEGAAARAEQDRGPSESAYPAKTAAKNKTRSEGNPGELSPEQQEKLKLLDAHVNGAKHQSNVPMTIVELRVLVECLEASGWDVAKAQSALFDG